MTATTFTARFTDCEHTRELPLLHSAGHVNCFVCQPELREQPIKGMCGDCAFDNKPEPLFAKQMDEDDAAAKSLGLKRTEYPGPLK